MDDLAKRLEKITVNMSHILAERKGDVNIFRYLGDKDREIAARKMMEIYFEREKIELQRQIFNSILGRYKILVDLGVELDVCTKIEIRQYVSRLARQDLEQVQEDQPPPHHAQTCTGCENCVY